MFLYKKLVNVLPLSYVDDILTLSRCGTASLSLNTFVTAQIETKKLKFHTPDINGKSKCHFLHIGKPSKLCPELQVHGTKMEQVSEETYLGDIISDDGRNSSNIKARVSKGLGIITQIMNLLEQVTLGEHYFSTAVLLRESMFLNGVLTNSEVWYGLKQYELEQLENLDKDLMKQILQAPFSTPSESLFLELGCLDIKTVIKARRINYLHYLSSRNPTAMLHKFFKAQWKYPTSQDWTEQVKIDLEDFNIPIDLEFIKSKSEYSFKNLVKIKAREYAFDKFMMKKLEHSKLDDLIYTKLEIQKYLKSNQFTVAQARSIFSFRTRMSNFKENFQGNNGHNPCPLCCLHLDSQSMIFQCPQIKQEFNITCRFEDIFSDTIPLNLVQCLEQVLKYRENYIQERSIQ